MQSCTRWTKFTCKSLFMKYMFSLQFEKRWKKSIWPTFHMKIRFDLLVWNNKHDMFQGTNFLHTCLRPCHDHATGGLTCHGHGGCTLQQHYRFITNSFGVIQVKHISYLYNVHDVHGHGWYYWMCNFLRQVFQLLLLHSSCSFVDLFVINAFAQLSVARRGGVEVAGWTVDQKIRVRFPGIPSLRVGPLMARR